MARTAVFTGSPMPCSIWISKPSSGTRSRRAVAMAAESERTLWLPKAGRTTSTLSSMRRARRSNETSASGLWVKTGVGQPSWRASTVS